jgi:DnaJ-class molecular chaperone
LALALDPYQVLGVAKTASQDEIQKAYRKLAKKLHPDLNPGNKQAEDKFKEASAAYDLLGDPEKRGRFDRGEIDASGAETQRQHYYRDYAEGGQAGAYANNGGFADFAGSEDIFADLFGRGGGGRSNLKLRGQDVRYRLAVAFLDAVNGAVRQLKLPDGSEIKVTIPSGTRDGQTLRLRGKGGPGFNGGPSGDALIEVEVMPHPFFTLKDDDIHVELPITLTEAVLGAKVNAPTPTGTVSLTIPKSSNTGKVLRLKGKGMAKPGGGHGDQYVTLKIVLPDAPDTELEEFADRWQAGKSYNPRRAMEG